MDKKPIRDLFLLCECRSTEHLARFAFHPKTAIEPAPSLYLEIHLKSWEGFFRRAWAGLRYIFGAQSSFGAWDEIIVTPKQAEDLRALLDEYLAEAKCS